MNEKFGRKITTLYQLYKDKDKDTNI